MKDQINRFARGAFEYEPPVIETSVSIIYEVVNQNREATGSLRLFDKKGRELKGVIFSDNDRVCPGQKSFCGNDCTIQYVINSSGSLVGDVIEGNFSIISNGGELIVPYSFKVEAGSYDSTSMTVRNLTDFGNLAVTNAAEAVKLMNKSDFADVFIGDDLALRCIYEGIIKGLNPYNNLEEFLIAIRKKNRTVISISRNNSVYDDIDCSFKDVIAIERNQKGYADIQVQTDSDFIRLEKDLIEPNNFTDDKAEFTFVVDYDSLHDGKNTGEIVFKTLEGKYNCPVTVYKNHRSKEAIADWKCRKYMAELLKLYLDMRVHKIPLDIWCVKTESMVEKMRAENDATPFYRILLAQVYIIQNKTEQALWLIENVAEDISTDNSKDYPLYCYYLYVCSLYKKDKLYTRKTLSAVERCYVENDDWRILWVLLFLNEEYENNKSLKLIRIKDQFNKGSMSPALLLEACNVFNEHPELLRVVNKFEMAVLDFGARYGILGEKLCSHFGEISAGIKNGSRNLARLLTKIYETSRNVFILEVLCRMLIRNNYRDSRYNAVFEEGVKADLNITRLFEYYVMSRKNTDMSVMPKMVLMYFAYGNELDYESRVYLFTNLINNKEEYSYVYPSFVPQMEAFVLEQVEAGRINEQLAFIYKAVINPSMITQQNARMLSEVYFTYKITCPKTDIRKVIVRHKEVNYEKEYAVSNNTAYVKIYTDDCAVFFENENQERMKADLAMCAVKLFENDSALKKCLKMDDSLIFVRLSECEKTIHFKKKSQEAMEDVMEVSSIGSLNHYFRNYLVYSVIDYFYENFEIDEFRKYLDVTDISGFDEVHVGKIIELCIAGGDFDKAFEIMKSHSIMHVSSKRLASLCSKMIENDRDEDRDYLCFICEKVLRDKNDNPDILQYLSNYYNGPLENMILVWRKAADAKQNTQQLEERILAQMMFTGNYVKIIVDVFDDYYMNGPDERICEAYLAYCSYLYFEKEYDIPEQTFMILETAFENERNLHDICRFALLKKYSNMHILTEFRKNLAREMIFLLARKDMVFPFFKKFERDFSLPFEIVDKTIVEYRANPAHRVVINYHIGTQKAENRDFESAEMKSVSGSFFAIPFVVFYGEMLEYYITEYDKDKVVSTEKRTIINKNTSPKRSRGRYESINDILAVNEEYDEETLKKLMHCYVVNEYITNTVFKPL